MSDIKRGDNVLIQARVSDVDRKRGVAKVVIGWGPHRTVVSVNLKQVERPLTPAMREALSWAEGLLKDDEDRRH